MNATTTIQTKITLELTASEAILLKGMMQNSMPDDSPEIIAFKENMFNALPPFQELVSAMRRAAHTE